MAERKRRHDRPQAGTDSSDLRPTWVLGSVLLLIAVGLLVVFVFWPGPAGEEVGAPHDAGSEPAATENVMLITLDTTRADHVGCYGYEAARTPAIDSLAASGVRFEQAFCQAPLTLPSHASLLTGLYPISTGVRINGAAGLGPDVPTLAEVFKDQGYRTGAFIGAEVLESSYGLNRGFEVYDDDISEGQGADSSRRSQRRADRVVDLALKWLTEDSRRPFFAWVHFFDPHTPYEPPREFAGEFPSPYDGEIAFVDSQIRRLVAWLDAKGLRERTLIVVAGDHGEGLDEHGELTHGCFVYNTTMRVPLIVAFPQEITTPRTVASPVRLIDVFPTIVDLMGWESAALDLDGRSLAHACRTGDAPTLAVFGESEYPRMGFGWAPLRFLLVDQWKYIDAPKPELYDWRGDPPEQRNLIGRHPDIADRLRRDLLDVLSNLRETRRAAGPAEVDAAAIERLASLGYIGASASDEAVDDGATHRDPKEMLEVLAGFERGIDMFREGDYEEAARILASFLEQSPESDEIRRILGIAYAQLGRFREAQSALEMSLRSDPNNRQRWFALGEALSSQGELDDAVLCYEQALALAPDWELAHTRIASALTELKRLPEAESHWRRCIELNPASTHCLTNFGSVLAMLGKTSEAARALEEALGYDPANEYAHRSLWQVLLAAGRRTDAIRSLKAAQRMFPDEHAFVCPLAWLVATTPRTAPGEVDNAIEWAKACCAAAPRNARGYDALAAAYAAKGDFAHATETARRAISMAEASESKELQRAIEGRLRLYQSGRRFVESP
jgi:arylsulfatase A-like enzyme/Flp pilus assembly protein TadD